jgi:hypothetical protein
MRTTLLPECDITHRSRRYPCSAPLSARRIRCTRVDEIGASDDRRCFNKPHAFWRRPLLGLRLFSDLYDVISMGLPRPEHIIWHCRRQSRTPLELALRSPLSVSQINTSSRWIKPPSSGSCFARDNRAAGTRDGRHHESLWRPTSAGKKAAAIRAPACSGRAPRRCP